ncbi:MAG: hypothetical protein KDB02_07095 [Acidimicrobiales bacterium]|nr:hypothetical protein [Acidimicrobiales bacterium]
MLLAELELYLSRPVAPTRRIALGDSELPVGPGLGFGGLLLGAVVARFVPEVDRDFLGDLERLTRQLEAGHRIPQPRLRHRLQRDRIGLTSHAHRLRGDGERLEFDLDERGNAMPNVLGAIYAAGRLTGTARAAALGAARRGLAWRGSVGPSLVEYLGGDTVSRDLAALRGHEPRAWALGLFGLTESTIDGPLVHRRFRELVRAAHPDHGGDADVAASRLDDLARARRILTQG